MAMHARAGCSRAPTASPAIVPVAPQRWPALAHGGRRRLGAAPSSASRSGFYISPGDGVRGHDASAAPVGAGRDRRSELGVAALRRCGDAEGLPLRRLLRLSLFQVSVGMATVLLTGTLNRVMIVELGVPAALVALMVALPVLFAPLRALLGFRSDNHRSRDRLEARALSLVRHAAAVRRPGDHAVRAAGAERATTPARPGPARCGAALAFLMAGAGHAHDADRRACAGHRPARRTRRGRASWRCFMSCCWSAWGSRAIVVGWLLRDFTPLRLIQVVQGAAVVTMVLNLIALWKQEAPRRRPTHARDAPRPALPRRLGRSSSARPRAGRLLAVVALGTLAFNMQDVLLEPYGGEILGLSVSARRRC